MDKIQVLIVHEDTLVSIGVQKILNEMFNIKSVTISNTLNSSILDEYNLIFTSIQFYSIYNESFIANKHKTIIVSPNLLPSQKINDNVIVQDWSEERIINQINKTITKLNNLKSIHSELSKREIDVLKLIAKGHINKEIADLLNISFNTVLTHRKNITAKLGIKSVSGLSVYAMMNGYITSK